MLAAFVCGPEAPADFADLEERVKDAVVDMRKAITRRLPSLRMYWMGRWDSSLDLPAASPVSAASR
jgi:hypothetical protein